MSLAFAGLESGDDDVAAFWTTAIAELQTLFPWTAAIRYNHSA